jgi:ElaA protein
MEFVTMQSSIRWRWGPFEALSTTDLYAIIALREAVFVVEQRCAYLDCDGLDRHAWHLLGELEGELVAYLRMLPPGVVYPGKTAIGRVVVAAEARGGGVGARLMREGMRRTLDAYSTPIEISAQAYLEGWYTRLGFQRCGADYLEDGIPHLPMLFTPESASA